MASMEQTTIARIDGAHLSAAAAYRRAGRALPITHWRRVLAALCLACAGVGLVGQSAHVPLAHAAGNSDAAHACQHGGYATLLGVGSGGQITPFTNEGDCVSYAASGGQFTTPLTACTVTGTAGCLVFDHTTIPSEAGDGSSITLTGATTFDDTCISGYGGGCQQSIFPNALATGGGAYVERDSRGAVTSQGIYRVADTAGSLEGTLITGFLASDETTFVPCATAYDRLVWVVATLIDNKTGATQNVVVGVETTPTLSTANVYDFSISSGVTTVTAIFSGAVPNSTITC